MTRVACTVCNGSGTVRVTCYVCEGTKKLETFHIDDDIPGCGDIIPKVCPRCGGTGMVRTRCKSCDGTGYLTTAKRI
jgi:DnaJ-class molecular chaperone